MAKNFFEISLIKSQRSLEEWIDLPDCLAGSGRKSHGARLQNQLGFRPGKKREENETKLFKMLSGGQKQRISLARAMLSPCDLLILDNVLSAVDYETERFLLEQIFQNREAQRFYDQNPGGFRRFFTGMFKWS